MSNSTSKWFKYLTENTTMCEMCGTAHHGGCPDDRHVEHDDEGRMAKSQLYKIANYAKEIHDNIGDDDPKDITHPTKYLLQQSVSLTRSASTATAVDVSSNDQTTFAKIYWSTVGLAKVP